ncbi:hypothetical protein E2C01_005555 [Portunus trituberculatus]|uniref:Uncharacterized protein n=1 Tax=Portunus trituberculatus TaxID=210409 RepID=A0A5B7CT12_PORTR|nr:hypothetical protein [Portunus trituberculatus]
MWRPSNLGQAPSPPPLQLQPPPSRATQHAPPVSVNPSGRSCHLREWERDCCSRFPCSSPLHVPHPCCTPRLIRVVLLFPRSFAVHSITNI